MATKKTPAKKAAVSNASGQDEGNEPVSKGKELAAWEKRMAEKANEAAESASSSGGSSPSIGTRGGRMTIDGAEVDGNKLEVVVLDFCHEVTYYDEDFDSDNIVPPLAFALGRLENDLEWHENSHPDYAGKDVASSDIFQWGSAPKGRGKAAKSRRRLLVISAEDLDEDIAAAEVRKFMVPTMSAKKEWDAYVKQIRAHGRAPCGVLTEISLVPDDKSQFRAKFKMVGLIDDEYMNEIMDKVDSVQDELFAPFGRYDEVQEEEAPAKSNKAVARKAPAKPAKAPARGRR